MARTRIAIIGLGLAVAPHAFALRDLAERVEVVCGATRDVGRAEGFTRTYGFPSTTDIDGAIRDPSVDSILVLTPPNSHLEIAEAAFAAGKNVLLEKPLDISLDRARRIVEGAERAGVTLGVVLQHRFKDAALRLRDILSGSRLGTVEAASVSVPWWREQRYYDEPGRGTRARDGGGVLLTQAIHAIDLFRSLLDPVEVVAAQATTTSLHRMETEDYASALVRVVGRAPGTVTATTAFYPGDRDRIEIIGSLGSARMVGNDLQVNYLSGETEEIVSDSGTGGGADPMAFSHKPHRDLLADFLDAVELGRPPRVSGAEALRTQSLIEAILAAAPSAEPAVR